MVIDMIQESCIHFLTNKLFYQLLDILRKNFLVLKISNSEFLYIEVWFNAQKSKPLEMEDKINITLVIKYGVAYKKLLVIQLNLKIKYF